MQEGPFKQAVICEKADVIKEEYVVYKTKDDNIVKETYNRHWHYNNDFYDASAVEYLVKK